MSQVWCTHGFFIKRLISKKKKEKKKKKKKEKEKNERKKEVSYSLY